jgi:hypothetical protein
MLPADRDVSLWPPRHTEDVRDGWHRRPWRKAETLTTLDLEAGLPYSRFGVAAEVATARDSRPEGRVGKALHSCPAPRVGDHVLVEAKLAAGANDPANLRESTLLVGNGAKNERRNRCVERLIDCGELTGDPLDHLDLDRRLGGCLNRCLAQHRLRLDR